MPFLLYLPTETSANSNYVLFMRFFFGGCFVFPGVFCFSDFLSYHENELGITKLVYILGPSKIGVVYLFQCNCEVKTKDFLKLKKLT